MLNLNRNNFQSHTFHLVSPSTWPLYIMVITILTIVLSKILLLAFFCEQFTNKPYQEKDCVFELSPHLMSYDVAFIYIASFLLLTCVYNFMFSVKPRNKFLYMLKNVVKIKGFIGSIKYLVLLIDNILTNYIYIIFINKDLIKKIFIGVFILNLIFNIVLYLNDITVFLYKENPYKSTVIFLYRLVWIRLSINYYIHTHRSGQMVDLVRGITFSNIIMLYVFFVLWSLLINPYLTPVIIDAMHWGFLTVTSISYLVENIINSKYKPVSCLLAKFNINCSNNSSSSLFTNIGNRYTNFSILKKNNYFGYKMSFSFVPNDFKIIASTGKPVKGILTNFLEKYGYENCKMFASTYYSSLNTKQIESMKQIEYTDNITLSGNYKSLVDTKIGTIMGTTYNIKKNIVNNSHSSNFLDSFSNIKYSDIPYFNLSNDLIVNMQNSISYDRNITNNVNMPPDNSSTEVNNLNNNMIGEIDNNRTNSPSDEAYDPSIKYVEYCNKMYIYILKISDIYKEINCSILDTKRDLNVTINKIINVNPSYNELSTDYSKNRIYIKDECLIKVIDLETRDSFIENVAKLLWLDVDYAKLLKKGLVNNNLFSDIEKSRFKHMEMNIYLLFKDFYNLKKEIMDLEVFIRNLSIPDLIKDESILGQEFARTDGIEWPLREAYWKRVDELNDEIISNISMNEYLDEYIYHNDELTQFKNNIINRNPIENSESSSLPQFIDSNIDNPSNLNPYNLYNHLIIRPRDLKNYTFKNRDVLNKLTTIKSHHPNLNIENFGYENEWTKNKFISEFRIILTAGAEDNDNSALSLERVGNFIHKSTVMSYTKQYYLGDHLPWDSLYTVCNNNRFYETDTLDSPENMKEVYNKLSNIFNHPDINNKLTHNNLAYDKVSTKKRFTAIFKEKINPNTQYKLPHSYLVNLGWFINENDIIQI